MCAYCRVSTDQEDQQSSYELQNITKVLFVKMNFGNLAVFMQMKGLPNIDKEPYAISKMIEDCKNGKIDMIITKVLVDLHETLWIA